MWNNSIYRISFYPPYKLIKQLPTQNMILIFNILPISSSTNLYNIIGGTKLLPFFIDKKTLAKYIFHNRHPIIPHITFVYFIVSKILGRYA